MSDIFVLPQGGVMDDLSHNVKGAPQGRSAAVGASGPQRIKTLRAADVMPPFDRIGGEEPVVRPPDAAAVLGREIPKYDLAENILAEQRRVAAGRRRSPGRAAPAHEPTFSAASSEPGWEEARPAQEPMSGELAELQRVVMEIVARDIERLCRRPERQL